MGWFDVFRKKKVEVTDEQLKWNRMWELWEQGKAASPYAELMTYQSEVNNGGHDQYFFNVENNEDLSKEIAALETILSDTLIANLHQAYKAHLMLEENAEDEKAEEIMEQCDDEFFANEEEINKKLERYADTLPV